MNAGFKSRSLRTVAFAALASADFAANHFPSIIRSQKVGGKLVALPISTAAPAN